MSIVQNANGDVIRRSKNLRGLREHARLHGVAAVSVNDTDGRFYHLHEWRNAVEYDGDIRRYEYTVTFANGDIGRDFFADWRIAADFTANRRSWGKIAFTSDVAGCAERYQGSN